MGFKVSNPPRNPPQPAVLEGHSDVGTLLSVAAFPTAAAAFFVVGGIASLSTRAGVAALLLKLISLDKKEEALSGQ